MSSKTEFNCDFCGDHIISGGTTPSKTGWCLDNTDLQKVKWSTNLHRKLNGVHICECCIEAVVRETGIPCG